MAGPRYREIAEDLRGKIESGDLPPSSQLPTELELQEEYEASRNTVRDAVKSLIIRGLVETRPGQGTFVTEKIVPFVTTLTGDPETASGGEGNTYTQEVRARLRQPQDTPPRVELQMAGDLVARELQITKDDQVVVRSQERFIDGTPWSLQASYYPMGFVDRGARRLLHAINIDEGTVAYLQESVGINQAGYRDRMFVRAPNPIETSFFRLPDDGRVSVIELRRTAFDDDGTPTRLTVSAYPADRNQFAFDIGKVPAEVTDPSSGTTSAADPAAEASPGPAPKSSG